MKTLFKSLLVMMAAACCMTGCSSEESYKAEVIDLIQSEVPSAIDICQKIDDCANYYFLNYASEYACMRGLTKTVLYTESDSYPYIKKSCTAQLEALLSCESDFTCTEIVLTEYTNAQSTLCPKTYEAYRACIVNEKGCLSTDDCADGYKCSNNVCVINTGCTQDSDCGDALACMAGTCVQTCGDSDAPYLQSFTDTDGSIVYYCSVCSDDCVADPAHPYCTEVHACSSVSACPDGEVFEVKNGYAECVSALIPAGCTEDSHCAEGYVCDLKTGTCVNP